MSSSNSLVHLNKKGLYCAQGNFYIDPWDKVEKAIITHAHADHARSGIKHYLAHENSVGVMKYRLGSDISVQGLSFKEEISINGVKVSLFPAGHIHGSAQVRLEHQGEVWVITSDFKTEKNQDIESFEPIPCHHLVMESTFGLPIFKWKPQQELYNEINNWWEQNAQNGLCSVIFGYSLGKAQRILNNVNTEIGPVYLHGAIYNTNDALLQNPNKVKHFPKVDANLKKEDFKGALVVAPPSANGTTWMRRFGPASTGIASGWMALRGARRRRAVDRGFVISDHADWNGLIKTVHDCSPEHVYVTHGYSDTFAKYLNETGYKASVLETHFEGELAEINETQKEEAA